MLFLAACGGSNAGDSSEGPSSRAEGETELSVPAVWSTRPIDRSVSDLALAGGAASAIAVAYSGGGLQLFNLEGDRTTDIAELELSEIAPGAYFEFGETGLTLFPGIDPGGALLGYVHSEGLPAPVQVELPIEATGPVEALCSRALGFDEDGELELAFWAGSDEMVTRGILGTEGDAFTFEATEGSEVPSGATGCAIGENGITFSVNGSTLAKLVRDDIYHNIFLIPAGSLTFAEPGEDAVPLAVRDGISVRMPAPIAAMDALGQPLGGGYPGGVIVVGGPTGTDDQLVFIDTSAITAPDR